MAYPKINSLGWKFREQFTNAATVANNGGIVTGSLPFDNGVSITAINQGITYSNFEFSGQELTLIIDLEDLVLRNGFYQTFVSNRSAAGDTYFEVGLNNTASDTAKILYFFTQGTSKAATATIGSSVKQLTFTKDASHNINFYADGVKVGDTVAGVALGTPLRTLKIGNVLTFASNQYANATFKDVRFFDRAFSADEVLDVYEQDTFSEVDESKFLISVPLRSLYDNGSIVVTRNIGSLGGYLQAGDGTDTASFPDLIFPKGMTFNGSSTFLCHDTAGAFGTGSFTLYSVFRTSDTPGASIVYHNLINRKSSAGGQDGYALTAHDSASFFVRGGGSSFTLSSPDSVQDGKLHIAVGFYDADNGAAYLYLDGELVDSTTGLSIGDTDSPDRILGIGAEVSSDYTEYLQFDGDIYISRIKSGTITESQVKWLYQYDRQLINV